METEQLTKWIPLACVIGAGGLLWSLSQPTRLKRPESEATRMKGAPPKTDYVNPSLPRDPFAQPAPGAREEKKEDKPGKKSRRSQDIKVDGIFWDPTTPMVSINGRILSEGEKIKKFQVIKIYPDHVVLDLEGKKVVKRLAP